MANSGGLECLLSGGGRHNSLRSTDLGFNRDGPNEHAVDRASVGDFKKSVALLLWEVCRQADGPHEVVGFFQELVQRQDSFAEPRDEPTECREAASDALHVPDTLDLTESFVGCDLLGVGFDPRSETMKPSSIPLGTPKTHFSGLSLMLFSWSFAKVRSRSYTSPSACFDLTTMSST